MGGPTRSPALVSKNQVNEDPDVSNLDIVKWLYTASGNRKTANVYGCGAVASAVSGSTRTG